MLSLGVEGCMRSRQRRATPGSLSLKRCPLQAMQGGRLRQQPRAVPSPRFPTMRGA